jgi:hypothetical protein
MAYPERLMRKRKAMDERLPIEGNPTVDELVRRLSPAIKSILTDNPPVLTRTSDIPVTDTLPAPQVGFRTPEVGYENATQQSSQNVPPAQPDVPVGRFSRTPPSTETPPVEASNIAPSFSRLRLPDAETQQDASTIPVGDRRTTIMDASNQLKRIPSNNVTYEGRASMPSFDAPPLGVNPEAAQDTPSPRLSRFAPTSTDQSTLAPDVRRDAVMSSSETPLPVRTSQARVKNLSLGKTVSLTKPQGAPEMQRTGNHEADVDNYIRNLEAYKPEDHNGRWKSALISAGRMFLQGLASGNIAQAVGAAIFGGVYGGFHKGFDEELSKQYNLSRAEREQAKVYARKMAGMKAEDLQSEIDARRNAPKIAADKAAIDAAEKERDNLRGVYTNLDDFDPANNQDHKAIADRAKALNMVLPAKAKGEKTKPRWKNEGMWWTLDDKGQTTPLIDPQTNKQMVDRTEQAVAVPDSTGTPRIVSQTTALNADVARDNQTYRRGRDETSDNWRASEWDSTEQKRYGEEKAAYDAATASNADIERQIAEKKKEQAENEKIANDRTTRQEKDDKGWFLAPNVSKEERASARSRANTVRDEIGRLEASRKRVPQPTPPRPAPRSTPQSASPATSPQGRSGKTLQRVDSSSMDGQVKTHFANGGKAIKVKDVKTGKETLVDNYNDYLVAIGRK